ncbi:MAG TPA: AI-2E family transporter, partial [Pantoea sp.]|nr:AI-2E family transporter [Pantoea sp.]
ILRPLLVGKDTKMPDYLILIATLGGMEIYGINGFVIGPVIAALFIACWNLLSGRDNRENIEEIDEEVIEEGKKQSDTAAEAAAEAAAAAADAAAEAEIKVSALAAAEAEKTASASKK